MSEYGFGYYGDESGNPGPNLGEQPPADAGPKWFRDYMETVSKQVKDMSEELKALRHKDVRASLSAKFEAEGIAPGAANLYQGDPEKVDDWIKANKDFLAKTAAAAPEGEQPEAGQGAPEAPATSVVPPEGQEAIARMQAAGVGGVASPRGSEQELAASITATSSREELAAIFEANGNPLHLS